VAKFLHRPTGLLEGANIVDINLEFLRLPTVLERTAKSRSVFFREVGAGLYTPPVKIGRNSFWPRHEINTLMAAEMNGATQEQMKRLVLELLAQRKALMPVSMREAEAA
jgi:predicted DNA-binding transcriptional regulator AlpA